MQVLPVLGLIAIVAAVAARPALAPVDTAVNYRVAGIPGSLWHFIPAEDGRYEIVDAGSGRLVVDGGEGGIRTPGRL